MARVLLVMALLLGACSGGGDSEGVGGGTALDEASPTSDDTASDEPAADGTDDTDESPEQPAPIAGDPGDLLWVEPLDTDAVRAWTVGYVSTGINGVPVEVTGTVVAPEADVEPLGVVSWAHGTTGMADACAPSAQPESISSAALALAQDGYVVAVTDYEGLGTDGIHPYLVGESEARSTIDIVRALPSIDDLTGVDSGRYAVAGLSQGGHAALWAGQIAPGYAPELELVGVVAAAPAAGISEMMVTIGTPAQGFAVMTAVAYAGTYPDVALADYFTFDAIDAMTVVNTGCVAEVFAAFIGLDAETMVLPAAWDADGQPIGALVERLAQNEAGQAPVEAPVLLIQGEADAIVTWDRVEAVQRDYCALDTNAELRLYLGRGHGAEVVAAYDEVLAWLGDRFEGVEAGDGCATVDPDVAAIRAAELTAPAVEGTLFDGVTPFGYDRYVSETTAPPIEVCSGHPTFGGQSPAAYSSAVWAQADITGPFLDGFVARFASPGAAAEALASLDAALIDCGSFVEPVTRATLSATRATGRAELGEESIHYDLSGDLQGVPVARAMVLVRVGDAVYGAAQSQAFTAADPTVAVRAVQNILP